MKRVMTTIVKTLQLRQARLRRSLETSLSLSTCDWLDDFINHHPNDELVCGEFFLSEID